MNRLVYNGTSHKVDQSDISAQLDNGMLSWQLEVEAGGVRLQISLEGFVVHDWHSLENKNLQFGREFEGYCYCQDWQDIVSGEIKIGQRNDDEFEVSAQLVSDEEDRIEATFLTRFTGIIAFLEDEDELDSVKNELRKLTSFANLSEEPSVRLASEGRKFHHYHFLPLSGQ